MNVTLSQKASTFKTLEVVSWCCAM